MNEIEIVQNAGLGAVVLWRFAEAYSDNATKPAPLPILFIVLPIVFHRTIRETIASTRARSGFGKVLQKLSSLQPKQADLIEGINARALELRPLTLRSLRILLASNFARLNVDSATILTSSKESLNNTTGDVKEMLEVAAKLGEWLSQMTMYEITLSLKVRF